MGFYRKWNLQLSHSRDTKRLVVVIMFVAKLHGGFSAPSLWSVLWPFGGHTLHSYLVQRGRSNFLCPESREDNVRLGTLTQGWHTAATLRGRRGHFTPCFSMQNGSDVHIRLLLWINRSLWQWIKCVVIMHDELCTFQGCVSLWGLQDRACGTRFWLWGLQEFVHR